MLTYKRIWVLDESRSSLSVYKEILDTKYLTSYFETTTQFKNALLTKNGHLPDLIISDLHPLKSEEMFSIVSTVPFVVISEVDSEDEIRYCLARGAIDYLMKPIRKSEIIVKIEKYLSKNELDQNQFKLLESIKKSLGTRLTIKEIAILESFFKSTDLSATRKTIMDHVWINVIVNPKTLDVHLYNLRKKLNDIGVSIAINTPGCWQLSLGEIIDTNQPSQDFFYLNT